MRGGYRIRTCEPLSGQLVFETSTINRSDNPPMLVLVQFSYAKLVIFPVIRNSN